MTGRNSLLRGLLTLGLGIFFIASAILKIFPIEHFETTLAYYGLSITLASIVARILIAVELGLGLLLFSSLRRQAVIGLIGLLAVLSAALIWFTIQYPDAKDCGCMGKYAQIPPIWALARNFVLILALFGILSYDKLQFSSKVVTKLLLLLPIASLLALFIVHPPDFVYATPVSKLSPGIELKSEKWEIQDPVTGEIGPWNKEGDRIVAYFSTKCLFCKRAATRLDAFYKTGKLDPKKSTYLFMGKPEEIEDFWAKSGAEPVAFSFLEPREIVEPTDGSLPTIFLLRDGIAYYQLGYLELTESNLERLGELSNEEN